MWTNFKSCIFEETIKPYTMFDGLLNVAGKLIPDETKAKKVYEAIDRIMTFQAAKFSKSVYDIKAIISKDEKEGLVVEMWIPSDEDGLVFLGKIEEKELIKIVSQ